MQFLDGFKFVRSSQTLTGDRSIYNVTTKMAEAWDNLEYDDANIKLLGNHLTLDTTREYFHWTSGVRGFFQNTPWRFTAKELEGSSGEYNARRLNYTSCDRKHPHYHIWSWKAKIKPGQSAKFTHAVFHVGPVPLFYFPYYSKDLSNEPSPTVYLDPGQNGREGTFVRSIISYPMAQERLYLRAHIDYLQKIGVGLGPEVLFRNNDTYKGALYAYTIKEKSGIRQWDVRGDGFAQTTQHLSFQGSLRYLQDPNFNNLYFKDNLERVTPQAKSSLAANWLWAHGNLRAYYDNTSNFDIVDSKFRSTDLTLPGFQGNLYQTPLFGSSFYLQGSASSIMHATRSNASQITPFDRWEDRGNVRLSRPWRLWRLPVGGDIGSSFSHNFFTKTSLDNLENAADSSYGGDLSANIHGIPSLDFTFNYVYNLRSEQNSLRQDTGANDKGVDTNKLGGLLIGSLPLDSYLMAKSAYNFKQNVYTPNFLKNTQRLDPVWASLTIPSPLLGSLSYSTNYRVYEKLHVDNFSHAYFHGDFSVNTTIVYDNSTPNVAIPAITGSARLPLLDTFFTYTVRGVYTAQGDQLSWKKKSLIFFDRDLVISPDLHDFLFAITFRERKDVREMFLAIRLKLSAESDEKFRRGLQEHEFYPWR